MDSVLELVSAELAKSAATLLDRVCQRTKAGQHWIVFGPNGAGKTSLVRVTSGRLSLNGRNVILDSQDLKGIDPAELAIRMALVSKSSAPSIRGGQRVLDPVYTAVWGINVHRGEEYEAEDEVHCQDLLEVFGISHLAQREPYTLSEGEAQWVLLARSLISDLEVLTLDELGVGLDLGARELLLSALEETMSGTRAPQAMLVTHQMEDIPTRIIHATVITKGCVIAQGPTDETLTSANLSHAHELPLSAGRDAGRWWVRGPKRG